MSILKVKDGFSLIELLVVIAIIGILAAVGTIGYSNYIESSKQKSLEANFEGIQKLVTTNLEVDEGFYPNESCDDYVLRIINENNRTAKNIYEEELKASGLSGQPVYVKQHCDSTPYTINLGQILLSCPGNGNTPDKQTHVCVCEKPAPSMTCSCDC